MFTALKRSSVLVKIAFQRQNATKVFDGSNVLYKNYQCRCVNDTNIYINILDKLFMFLIFYLLSSIIRKYTTIPMDAGIFVDFSVTLYFILESIYHKHISLIRRACVASLRYY